MSVKRKSMLGLVGALGLPLLAMAPTASAASTVGTPAVVPWAYQATAPSARYSTSASLAQARTFGVIVANPLSYATTASAMQGINPKLLMSVYVNGAYAQKNQGTSYPDSWYLRDEHGQKVRSLNFGNYAMNPANPGWIADVVNRCRTGMSSAKLPGCFLDMLGPAPVTPGYNSALSVNPATNRLFTRAEWLRATSSLAASVNKQLPAGAPLLLNGLSDGPNYFNPAGPTSQLLDGADGALAESWLRGSRQPLNYYPNESVWLQSVNMVSNASSKGKTVLMTTKVWASGSTAQQHAWHVFAVASYLMVANGKAGFEYLSSPTADPTLPDTMLQSLKLGATTGNFAKVQSSVYRRLYASGKVYVNVGTTSQTVQLDGTYSDQDGRVMTKLTLPANGATILTRR